MPPEMVTCRKCLRRMQESHLDRHLEVAHTKIAADPPCWSRDG